MLVLQAVLCQPLAAVLQLLMSSEQLCADFVNEFTAQLSHDV
jgi:hypothetical protein